jgi:ACR3 family arsenite efflux pump ArsB
MKKVLIAFVFLAVFAGYKIGYYNPEIDNQFDMISGMHTHVPIIK